MDKREGSDDFGIRLLAGAVTAAAFLIWTIIFRPEGIPLRLSAGHAAIGVTVALASHWVRRIPGQRPFGTLGTIVGCGYIVTAALEMMLSGESLAASTVIALSICVAIAIWLLRTRTPSADVRELVLLGVVALVPMLMPPS